MVVYAGQQIFRQANANINKQVWGDILFNVKAYGAKGDGVTDDTYAIRSAIEASEGAPVYFPIGTYNVSELIYPVASGQIMSGAGMGKSIITNTFNNEPLFCFGNPYVSDGAMEFCSLENLTIQGNINGLNLWGIFVPSFDEYDGVNSSSNNIYNGNDFVTWTGASRNCLLRNVDIVNIKGGYGLHISAWAFESDNVHILNCKHGFREAGDANCNYHNGLYISSSDNVSMLHPSTPTSNPKNCHYENTIVQQSGSDGNGSISLIQGEGTRITNLYLERNNESVNTSNTDLFLGASESNLVVDGVTHKMNADDTSQTIIKCSSHNARISNVDWREKVDVVLELLSSTTDFGCYVYNIKPRNNVSGTANTIIKPNTNSLNHIIVDETNLSLALGPHKLYRVGGGTAANDWFGISQGRSTGAAVFVESVGDVMFSADIGNVSSNGDFFWEVNGSKGTGTRKLELLETGGVLRPGSDNAQTLGDGTHRWSVVYAGTATINTSDAREKTDIQPEALGLSFINQLQPRQYKYVDSGNRAEDGTIIPGERIHHGLIAQEVKQVLDSLGIDHAAFVNTPIPDAEGNPTGETRMGLRYEEFISHLIKAVQELTARVLQLEGGG